jgi:SPP1 family predicted phage head-tail adaptor
MPAGELRERIAFEQQSAVSDGSGGQTVSWSEVFRCAARVKPRLGGEEVTAARLGGRQPVMITVRHSTDTAQVTPDWRARDVRSGAVYNIRTAVADERRQWVEMLAEKGVAT